MDNTTIKKQIKQKKTGCLKNRFIPIFLCVRVVLVLFVKSKHCLRTVVQKKSRKFLFRKEQHALVCLYGFLIFLWSILSLYKDEYGWAVQKRIYVILSKSFEFYCPKTIIFVHFEYVGFFQEFI